MRPAEIALLRPCGAVLTATDKTFPCEICDDAAICEGGYCPATQPIGEYDCFANAITFGKEEVQG